MKFSAPVFTLKRRAKRAARNKKIPLNEALNIVARDEGFQSWSALSSQTTKVSVSSKILNSLNNGDLLLLAGRPGEGKTILGLQLLLDAASQKKTASLFTFEYTREEAKRHLQTLNIGPRNTADLVQIDTSNDISANYVIQKLSQAGPGTLAIIDYVQLLDQKRSNPTLADQIKALADFAKRTGIIIGFISQIDRTFDAATKQLPDLSDIRLPNQMDMSLFDKSCFLHKGKVKLEMVGTTQSENPDRIMG